MREGYSEAEVGARGLIASRPQRKGNNYPETGFARRRRKALAFGFAVNGLVRLSMHKPSRP
jgi:hypothetical protein